MKPVSVFLILLVSLQFSCEQQANKQTDPEAAFVPPVNTKRMQVRLPG